MLREQLTRATYFSKSCPWSGFRPEVYALRKESEKMFEWLEHAWTTHDAGLNELLSNPFMLAYKDDPRFIAFAQKIGVMPKAAPKP